jgi:pyridoxamine 5'-phosphate oxidase
MPPLRREGLAADPLEQFRTWYGHAARQVPLAEAMTLATVDAEGVPDARMVLLKGFGPAGFRFFTNLGSAKARQLRSAPWAALVLYWRELDRQVRIRGRVERLSDPESAEYFATRPRDSQIGAWASPQSDTLADRQTLVRRAQEAERKFSGAQIPRPPFWGGFVVRPREIEFWQGQAARLHDRFRYLRTDGGWRLERLAP